MKSKIASIAVLSLLFSFMVLNPLSGALAQVPEAPSGEKISSVTVKGNSLITYDEILAAVSLRPGDILSQSGVNNDLRSIYAMGFFREVRPEYVRTARGVSIIYNVAENTPVSEITLVGITVYSTEEVLDSFRSKIGMPLSFAQVRSDIAELESKYHEDGYILAKVVDVSSDPETGRLSVRVVEGVIEGLSLDGNTNTKDYVLLREINSKPGTVLNEKVLGKDLRRLFNLGFFSEVTPDFQPGQSPDTINLVVRVKEGKTTTINFGGGYGEREGWFGFVDLNSENLMGSGQGVMIRGQAGQQLQTYQLRYTYPWLFPDKLGDRVLFSARRWLTIGKNVYLVETVEKEGIYNGWEIGFSKPFNDEWSTGLTLGSENVNPTGAATFEPYTSNTVGLSLSYDTRDNWMNPSRGDYFVFGVRRGWKYAASGETNFSKWSTDLNRFFSPFERHTLAGRVSAGLGLGDVPVGELYYAGGANTIRGYEPMEARSGTKKFIINVEYRVTFNDIFQGVLFYDWGNAWYNGWPNTYNFISGKGLGVRFNTPMGPIRLDYGVAANRSFSEGALHFSIGHAF